MIKKKLSKDKLEEEERERLQQGGYFEGVLQLRNPTKELIKTVRKMIDANNKVFIGKEERVDNGIDLYISSQKYLQTIGKKLQKQFPGELKTSRTLFTLNNLTSKRVYRVTVLFRLPLFKVGDTIKTKRKQEIKIKSLGKKIFGIDTETGRKVSVNYDDIN